VNAASDDGTLASLADRIAAAIPGLWGYVGVDLVLTRDGPVVLEINPRLTTSYCGMGQALGINTAGLVLSLLGRNRLLGVSHAS
jgi:predicted ATP-grasp superfamily ATP-dependent carboligase